MHTRANDIPYFHAGAQHDVYSRRFTAPLLRFSQSYCALYIDILHCIIILIIIKIHYYYYLFIHLFIFHSFVRSFFHPFTRVHSTRKAEGIKYKHIKIRNHNLTL